MSKSKHDKLINDPTSQLKITMPDPIANGVASAFGHPMQPVITQNQLHPDLYWEELDSLAGSVVELFMKVSEQFEETTRLVKEAGGLDNPEEYNRVVTVTCADLERFSTELAEIKAMHANYHGIVVEAQAHSTYMMIFEKYRTFSVYFNGAMHHIMIAMTDFALEAASRMKKREQEARVAARADLGIEG